MEDNDLQEHEKKSLLKDMAKKGISKTIKAIPLKYKLIIIGVIAAVILSLIIIVTLIGAVTMLFDFKIGGRNGSGLSYSEISSGEEYIWPVGGSEKIEFEGAEYAVGAPTVTYVYRGYLPEDGHYGLDISWRTGDHYIVATASGIVYTAVNSCADDGRNTGTSTCGGNFGNYVIIDHQNGNYSVYAHLRKGTVTVSKGDSVKQGQILGIMGNSGNSSGQHLHFQLEIGGRGGSKYGVDPLASGYIGHNNQGQTKNQVNISTDSYLKEPPKTKPGIAGDLITMLHSWEGTYFYDNAREYYKIYDDGTGTLTVGYGVTLKYNAKLFEERGIDITKLSKGDKLPVSLVDDIEEVILENKHNEINNMLLSNSITLENHQIDALLIRSYNYNLVNFVSNYKQYGNTQSLYDNYMNKPVTGYNPNTGQNEVMDGLKRRRAAEWTLFHNGIYQLNS